jgi:hypothetical protein
VDEGKMGMKAAEKSSDVARKGVTKVGLQVSDMYIHSLKF